MAQRTRRYLIRRAVVVLLTLFAVTLLSFLLMRLSPICRRLRAAGRRFEQ